MSLLRKAVAAQGLLALLKGKYNDAYGEWDEVSYAGIPLWRRDAKGKGSILGIPVRRRRKPRKE